MGPELPHPALLSAVQWLYFISKLPLLTLLCRACSSLPWDVPLKLLQMRVFWKTEELFATTIVIFNHLCRKQLLLVFHQVTASESFSLRKSVQYLALISA